MPSAAARARSSSPVRRAGPGRPRNDDPFRMFATTMNNPFGPSQPSLGPSVEGRRLLATLEYHENNPDGTARARRTELSEDVETGRTAFATFEGELALCPKRSPSPIRRASGTAQIPRALPPAKPSPSSARKRVKSEPRTDDDDMLGDRDGDDSDGESDGEGLKSTMAPRRSPRRRVGAVRSPYVGKSATKAKSKGKAVSPKRQKLGSVEPDNDTASHVDVHNNPHVVAEVGARMEYLDIHSQSGMEVDSQNGDIAGGRNASPYAPTVSMGPHVVELELEPVAGPSRIRSPFAPTISINSFPPSESGASIPRSAASTASSESTVVPGRTTRSRSRVAA